MRQLPYSARLLEQQRAGERPWLVLVMAGDNAKWRPLLRKMIAPGDSGVAWLWWPADFRLDEADLTPLIGTDVLVAGDSSQDARVNEVATEIWQRGQPATLWLLQHPDRKNLHLSPKWATFRAARVVPSGIARAPLVLNDIGVTVGQGLRAHMTNARQVAFLAGSEPLFSRPELYAARERALEGLRAA